MHAKFQGMNGAQLSLPLEDFLSTGLVYGHARAAMLDSGEDLLRDYVCEDAGLYSSSEELQAAFSEALQMATDSAVSAVEFDAGDLHYIREQFSGFRILEAELDPIVA